MLMRSSPFDVDAPPRVAPHNIDAEQALLGAILVHNDAYERASETVDAGNFYDPLHQAIFDAIGKLIAKGQSVSPATLRTYFENYPPITDDLTVPDYLVLLANNAISIASARDYAQTIRDLAIRRQIIMIGEDAAAAAFEADIDVRPRDIIEEAEAKLFALAEGGNAGGAVSFAQSVQEAIQQVNEAHMRGGGLHGLPTRLEDLDAMLGGMSPGELIILAGRPGMGKTALATTIAWDTAKHEFTDDHGEVKQNAVDFYSLEMRHAELSMRIIAAECGIPIKNLRRGKITEAEIAAMMRAAHQLREAPLWIDDRGGVTVAQIAARARRRKRKHNTQLIVIDYLQLIRGTGKENRNQDVAQITGALKALAKELEVPIIALSQLSRDVEKRTDKRPLPADLRDSGAIEQDADVILFAYREEYYLSREEPSEDDITAYSKWQQAMSKAAGKAEVIVGKQRHGETGTVHVAFEAPLTRFSNLSTREVNHA